MKISDSAKTSIKLGPPPILTSHYKNPPPKHANLHLNIKN